MKLTYDDVLLVPQYSDINSRSQTSLVQNLSGIKFETPILLAPMDTICSRDMVVNMKERGITSVVNRNTKMDNETIGDTFWAVGLNDDEKISKLLYLGISNICLDVAHGDQQQVYDKISSLAKIGVRVMAGNVVTAAATKRMRDAGASFVRVGVGSGAACSTRLMTGHGYPQLSAIEECSAINGITIIADGGIKTPGDIVKALAFGANLVMVGRMFAGTHWTPGEIIRDKQGNPKEKIYRGMASREVNKDMFGELSSHRAAEGESYSVPYKNLKETELLIQDVLGGIRSGLTYSGALSIIELQDKVEYVTVSGSTVRENGIHGK